MYYFRHNDCIPHFRVDAGAIYQIELPGSHLVQRTTLLGKMSVVYEPRNFIHEGSYPPIDDHHHDPTPDTDRFPDPSDAVVNELATTVATFTAPPPPHFVDTAEPRLDLPAPTTSTTTVSKENSPTATTPQRIKAIPKPDREVTKNSEGKFICTWPGCSEEPREFTRKCEWK